MFLHGLATALPPTAYTQSECWQIALRSPLRERLTKRSMLILQSILRRDHGIAKRHFALAELERVYDLTPDELNLAFRAEAPRLAGRALSGALDEAGLRPEDLDALFVCTCTGYLCPGVSSYVAEQLGLRANAFLQDLVGLGCGAAIPMLRSASHLLAARPDARVACIAVEICSAAFYVDDDPGVLVSACLFGDGAAATIWRSTPGATRLRAFEFNTTHVPADRDKLRFEQRGGKLRNLLDRSVPDLAAGAVRRLWAERGPRPVARVVTHAGGRDVLEALVPVLAPHPLDAAAGVLRECGNLSSPSVLFALEQSLRSAPPGGNGDLWLASFGAGFSAHCCRLGPE
jgi:alkylresorcinol/alkylpyrone synthase